MPPRKTGRSCPPAIPLCHALFFAVLQASAALAASHLTRVPADVPPDWVWVTVHRSARTMAPENTMASAVRCFSVGADCADNDLWLTLDGHLVVYHDYGTRLKAGGYWPIDQMVLSEVRELDAGSAMYRDHAGEGVPLFDDIVRFAALNGLKLYLDYKDETTRAAADSVLSRYDALDLVDWDRDPRLVTYNDKTDADRLAIARALVRRPHHACAVRVDDPRVTLSLLGRDDPREPRPALGGPPLPRWPDLPLSQLLAALSDSSLRAGRLAALAIAQGHPKAALRGFAELLSSHNQHAAIHAAWGLGELKGAEAVKLLLPVLEHPGHPTAEMACYSLGRIEDPATAPSLQAVLAGPAGPNVVAAAAWALGELGAISSLPSLHTALDELLSQPAEPARVAAVAHIVVALGKLASSESIEALRQVALASGYRAVGNELALALGRIGTTDAASAIVALHDTRWAWGQMAVRALASCAQHGHPHLVALMASPDQDAAMDALLALMNDTTAAPIVAAALQDSGRSALFRTRAALVLGYAGSDAQVPALAEALSSPSLVLRDQAAWSLERVGSERARLALRSSSHSHSFVNAATIDRTWRELLAYWDANLHVVSQSSGSSSATIQLRATNTLPVPVLQTVRMDLTDSPWWAFYRPTVFVALEPGGSEDIEFTVWHSSEAARPDSLPPFEAVVEIDAQPYRLLGPSYKHTYRYETPAAGNSGSP